MQAAQCTPRLPRVGWGIGSEADRPRASSASGSGRSDREVWRAPVAEPSTGSIGSTFPFPALWNSSQVAKGWRERSSLPRGKELGTRETSFLRRGTHVPSARGERRGGGGISHEVQ